MAGAENVGGSAAVRFHTVERIAAVCAREMVITNLGGEPFAVSHVGCGRAVRFAIQALNLRFDEFFSDGLHFVWSFWFSCAELRLFPAGGRTLPGKWRDSRLIGSDGAGGFRLCAVGEKADDDGALFLAKPARCTRSSRAGALSRTNDYFVPCGRGHGERRVGGEHDYDGPAVGCFQLVGFRQIVGGKIDRKTPGIRGAHGGSIARSLVPVANNGLVGIRPTPLSLVRVYQLGEHGDIDRIVFAGKIARLVMSPKLIGWERRNARDECRPIITAPLFRDLPPVEREGAARRCVTAFRFERARVWAGGCGGSGNRNRSGLYVPAFLR